ncbi:MAG: hypothetical protein QOF57_1179 [Frankiaceae bacterium]|nr:hypothetical protein [Frankiaceae bacterium]
MDTLLDRLTAARPHLADALSRPHAEEALLADVVASLEASPDGLSSLAHALGVGRSVERVTLWGVDLATGADDPALLAAATSVHPGAGRAVLREAEPDLLIVTADAVATVSVAVDRPGHAAARALRGEPIPSSRLAALSQALGGALDPDEVAAVYPAARTVAVGLAVTAGRPQDVIAIAAGGGLMTGADRTAAWLAMAERVEEALEAVDVHSRVLRWRELAAALGEDSPAYDVISAHPTAGR